MGKIIAFANQKGGVGKTTSAVNIAASVGILGKKVLLIDIDPQGNTTSGVGINKKNLKSTSYEILIGEIEAEKAIVKTEFENLWVIPSNISLAGAEFDLYQLEEREYRLKKQLESIRDEFDYIFLPEMSEKNMSLDSSKIKLELGWEPQTKFEDGIIKTIDWYLKNPDYLK